MKRYVLGLDLGESSVGWACIGLDDGGKSIGILDAGVRVFPPGRQILENRAETKTKAAERREHRSARRVKERHSRRKRHLMEVLCEAGLMPKELNERVQVLSRDPYELRARALNEHLQPFEAGRAIYNLAQRRGFKSNRKSEKVKKEQGEVYTGINELAKEMEDSKARTLGEYLFNLSKRKSSDEAKEGTALLFGLLRLRKRYASRQMFEEEFKAIWKAQSHYHPDRLTEELKTKVHDAIFFQRPFDIRERIAQNHPPLPKCANAWRSPQVASCSLLPSEKRCEAGIWVAQRFRLLKEVNNLRVFEGSGTYRDLSEKERKLIIGNLGCKKEMSFEAIRRLIKVSEDSSFNLEEGKRDKLLGNAVEAALVKALGIRKWKETPEEKKMQMRNALVSIEDPEKFGDEAKNLGLQDDKINDLQEFSPPKGFLRYSEKAINILVPYLEQGMKEHLAIEEARKRGELPKPSEPDVHEILPSPPAIPNPVVTRILHEARKIVNNLIIEYGKPENIVVELARNAREQGERLQEIIDTNRENEKKNEEARRWYTENGRTSPSREDCNRYRLWKEQKHTCPYTGNAISAQDILSTVNVLEIDHILPYELSLDDSYMNKVLCFTMANRDKRMMTPCEWKGGFESQEFDQMVTRIKNMDMPKSKIERFSIKKIDANICIERKLNDTKYASREVTKYLLLLYPADERIGQKRVFTTRGEVTAKIRRLWGLDAILGLKGVKNREDHRHHAVDAAVIACTDHRTLQSLAKMHNADRNGMKIEFKKPWESFRKALEDFVLKRERDWNIDGATIKTHGILVSHRVERKISGGLHEETNYGPTTEDNKFAYRVPLLSLTGAMVEKIRDLKIREIIKEHCKKKGVDPTKYGSKKLPAGIFMPPPLLPISKKKRERDPTLPEGIPINKVRLSATLENPLLLAGCDGRPYRAVKTGNNHHIEIYEVNNENGERELRAHVITMIEAARRARREKKPIVGRDQELGSRFIMSLGRGESVLLHKDGQPCLCFVQVVSSGSVNQPLYLVFRLHTDARKASEGNKNPFATVASFLHWDRLRPTKIAVDPVGRIHPIHD